MTVNTFTIEQDVSDILYRYYMLPTGVGRFTQWTPNGCANNWECVDELKDSSSHADYVSFDSDVTRIDMYDTSVDPELSGTISYVKVHALVTDYNPIIETSFHLRVGDGATDYQSNDIGLTNGYAWVSHSWSTNPDTAVAWLFADLVNLEIGFDASSQELEQPIDTIFRPDGDDSLELTPIPAGTHYTTVDEEIRDDDDYVYTVSGIYKEDIFTLEDIANLGTIHSITVYANCHATIGDLAREKILIETGGNVFYGSYHFLTQAPTMYSTTWLTNPDTSNPWTQNEVNLLKAGIALRKGITGEAKCTQLYVVVNHTPDAFVPEIRVASCYVEIGYTPSSDNCSLIRPEEVSRSHNRNIKMLNFWNGDREVYDLKRSSKAMVLQGVEFALDVKTVGSQTEVTYFHTAPDVPNWVNEDNAVDGGEVTGALSGLSVPIGWLQIQDANMVIAHEDVCTIQKVEFRVLNRTTMWPPNNISYRPLFTAGYGTTKYDISDNTKKWTPWFDITDDTNAPDEWVLADVNSLEVQIRKEAALDKTYIYKIEIKVTYILGAYPEHDVSERIACIREMGKRGAKVTLSGLGLSCYNGDFYIRSFGWDMISKHPGNYSWILELEDAGDAT